MGEVPVEDLESPLADVVLARSHIEMANKEVQLDGWYFNTENITLIPNDRGELLVPYDAVRVTGLPYKYVLMDGRIYDSNNKTFNIGRQLNCYVIKIIDFEKLPLSFAIWITLRASKKYQNNTLTSPALLANLEREEAEAMLVAKREHRDIVRPNLKGTSAGYHIQQVLRR